MFYGCQLRHRSHLKLAISLISILSTVARAVASEPPAPDGEAFFFTPPGSTRAGELKVVEGTNGCTLHVLTRDPATGQPTPCRINVVGADGNYYHPNQSPLSPYSLSGEWPKDKAKGNRRDKAPYRYLGRFFYSTGDATIAVPPGEVRVEVFKGFEFKPQTRTVTVANESTTKIEIDLIRTAPMMNAGYFGGDPHLHLLRATARDDETIFDLLDAEDIWFGTPLGYNEPAGPYSGFMAKLDYPQFRGLGQQSIKSRGVVSILSGQEYRSSQYGHLNLFFRDELIFSGQDVNADDWPVYGVVGSETKSQGGYAFHAHGGYAQEVYADAALGTVSGVELLQFGVYRGIGLADWHHMLNVGYRFPCVGASDYPACRFLGDCRTYVWTGENDAAERQNRNGKQHENRPDFRHWLQGAADGRSFVTTGPLLLLDVDGYRPGETIANDGHEPMKATARIRVRCEVTPVTKLDLIVNGQIVKSIEIPPSHQTGDWFTVEQPLTLSESSWIAARAWSTTAGGQPDAESHTNPVFFYRDGKKPYQQSSLDAWIAKIDGQMEKHRTRSFPQKSKVLDYFQRARDLLLKVREQQGLRINDDPEQMALAMERADAPSLAADVARPDATDEELREFLKPIPPKPASEAAKAFEGVAGFQMQVVAAEPLVSSPIAAAFDEDANLYICEMRDYPYKPADGLEPIGRVRLLRDLNGDGVYDEAHVFADQLLWPAGVVPWKGGVFVAAPPDIWYFKDTDGDHRADVKRKIFTGFGTGNQQAMVNNLQWSMDHWIYGSTAGNGGSIRPGDQPDATPISINGRDFRFDPVTEKFETITGTVQFGNTFDDWGNRFVCSESSPLIQVVLPDHYLARNPYLASPKGTQSIAPWPVPIYRISPIERWRQIRSSRRIASNKRSANSAGASHHVIDAAAGVTIYRGGAYPPEYYGQAFVGDGQNNLIHRRVLTPDGVPFKSERIDQQTDFIRSPDIWFRPVNLVNAPDGTLYCCDMSREFLESIHIPLDVVKHLDLKSGRENGRIYRVAPPGFRFPGQPRLSQATTNDLVAALESPHVWWRETALRLLHEREDQNAIPGLRELARKSPVPQSRLLALYSLKGFQSLDSTSILNALSDEHAGVRENAVRLAEPFFDSSRELVAKVAALADDDVARIRFQVAFSLGETDTPQAVAALARIARRDSEDLWIRTAVLSSVVRSADQMFAELIQAPVEGANSLTSIVGQLAQIVGVRNHPNEIAETLNRLAESHLGNDPISSDRLLLELGTGLKRAGGRLNPDAEDSAGNRLVRASLHRAEIIARDSKATVEQRVAAINLLSCSPSAESRQLFSAHVGVDQPEPIQLASIRALADDADSSVGPLLLGSLKTLAPEPRRAALTALLSREEGTRVLLEAALRNEVSVADVDQARREILYGHKNEVIRQLAAKVFGTTSPRARKSVVDDYKSSLSRQGVADRGKDVFQKNCLACHQLEGKGYAIGPNLASSASREPATLLTHILDPNQHVLPNYLQYLVVDRSGRTYTGLLAAQSATSITLKKERDELVTILRGDIDEFVSNNKSLMPEGLEKEISVQGMADLIAYLTQAANQSPADPNAERDFGTLPGLIETSRD